MTGAVPARARTEHLLSPAVCFSLRIDSPLIPSQQSGMEVPWFHFAYKQIEAQGAQVLFHETKELGSHCQGPYPGPSGPETLLGQRSAPQRPWPGAGPEPMKICVSVPGQL